MKTLFVLASVMVVIFLLAPNKVDAQRRKPTNKTTRSVIGAKPGFYIKLSRCHACSLSRREQQDAMTAFRANGLSAFYGDEKYDKSYVNIEFLKKLPGVQPFPFSLFVGPFQTQSEAQSVVSKVPTILRKQISEGECPTTSKKWLLR
jgi:hypothetical protein